MAIADAALKFATAVQDHINLPAVGVPDTLKPRASAAAHFSAVPMIDKQDFEAGSATCAMLFAKPGPGLMAH